MGGFRGSEGRTGDCGCRPGQCLGAMLAAGFAMQICGQFADGGTTRRWQSEPEKAVRVPFRLPSLPAPHSCALEGPLTPVLAKAGQTRATRPGCALYATLKRVNGQGRFCVGFITGAG